MYCGFITKINNLHKHPNADRLQIGTIFGNSIVVDLSVTEGQLGVFFPVDGQLSAEFCQDNKLCRGEDGGYLDPDKRNIKAIRLRGEKSEGLFLPLESLSSFSDVNELQEGSQITVLNGILICQKYIPGRPVRRVYTSSKKKQKTSPVTYQYPFFKEHIDTEQLMYNLGQFRQGDTCYITLKMHGTSHRCAKTVEHKVQTSWMRKLLHLPDKITTKPSFVSGTRRVVLRDFAGGFYGTNEFRQPYHEFFRDRLYDGETVYFEIVGYIDQEHTIMGSGDNTKLKDKEFVKMYGDKTVFSYGCKEGENQAFVYRMTMTTPGGYVVEYPTELVQLRCEQMGVEFVPVFDKFIYTTEEDLLKRVEDYVDGTDPVGQTHIREGVVVRIDNREKFTAYKHKNFSFKVLEGIIKEEAVEADIEEQQDLEQEEI